MRAASDPSDNGAVISLPRESGRKKKEGGVRVEREREREGGMSLQQKHSCSGMTRTERKTDQRMPMQKDLRIKTKYAEEDGR